MDRLYTLLIPNNLITPDGSPLGGLLTKLMRSHADGINYHHDTVVIDDKDFKRIRITDHLYHNPILRRDLTLDLEKVIILLGGDILNKKWFVRNPLVMKTTVMQPSASLTVPGSAIPAPFTNAVSSTTISVDFPGVSYEDDQGVTHNRTWEEYQWTTNWSGNFKEDDEYFYVMLSNPSGGGTITGKQAFLLSNAGSNLITKEDYISIGSEDL